MVEREVLYETKWLKLCRTAGGYDFSERKGVDSIGVFLVRHTDMGLEVLVRFQPLHMIDEDLHGCPITGSIDGDELPIDAAVREIEEESGYKLERDQVRFLTRYYVGTQTNEICFLYSADVTDMEQFEILGDGTHDEQISYNAWKPLPYLAYCAYGATKLGYYMLKERYIEED